MSENSTRLKILRNSSMTVLLPLLVVPWILYIYDRFTTLHDSIIPFDNDMKSYNTTLSSYYTNDNASSTVSLLFLNTVELG